jgi:hypothetical protein
LSLKDRNDVDFYRGRVIVSVPYIGVVP